MNNDRNNWAPSAKSSVCTVHVAASSSQAGSFHVLLLIGNMNPKDTQVFGPHEDEFSFDCPVSPVLTFKDRLHKPQLDFHQQESLTELSPLLSLFLFFCCHFSSMLMPLWSTSLCLKLTPTSSTSPPLGVHGVLPVTSLIAIPHDSRRTFLG